MGQLATASNIWSQCCLEFDLTIVDLPWVTSDFSTITQVRGEAARPEIRALTQSNDGSSHDWLDDVITFDVVSSRLAAGVTNLRAAIECRRMESGENRRRSD